MLENLRLTRHYPKRDRRYKTIVMVPIVDILHNMTASVDSVADGPRFWESLIERKTDRHLWRAVDYLSETDIAEVDPIVINAQASAYSDHGWTQLNGHHRLLAAILLGMDALPVVFHANTFGPAWLENRTDVLDDGNIPALYDSSGTFTDPVLEIHLKGTWK